VGQARRDSSEALSITVKHCDTPALQREAVRAIEFKCQLLWSLLDEIAREYQGATLSGAPTATNGGSETAPP
jgi:pyrroloquinoline-quinone synthase